MKGILGIVLALGLGGVLIWLLTRGGKAEGLTTIINPPETPSEPTTITVEGETYTFDEPGVYVIPGAEYEIPSAEPAPEPTVNYEPLTTEVPTELIPWTGTGSWYEIRNIAETFGLTQEQYAVKMEEIRQTPTEDKTAEELLMSGEYPTMELAQRSADFRSRVKTYGGAYINGVLTPPEWYEGSVTEFADWVRQSLERTPIS